MWYWRASNQVSMRYFDTALLACYNVEKEVIPPNWKLVRLLNIPSFPGDQYLVMGVEVHRGRLVPAIQLFPQERFGTPMLPSLTEEFNRIAKEAPEKFPSKAEFMRRYSK